MALLIQLTILIVTAYFVLKREEETKVKAIYAGILAGTMLLVFALTLVIEYLNEAQGTLAPLLAVISGYITIAVFALRNNWRSGEIVKGKKRKNHPSDKTVI